ncbi:hypothetical protein H6F88_00280 [Oculatella sp. FACHB-28]|uniref:hypothetical protein n=1 Tax=Oculatella sp. FACHB-28 TaxID=2692845 RepID=UPI001683B861|nr:hypothetical protein [Oculatella sp. FACHB-28]MBD2054486.1 hypothetical protein [Oculatella sp. FACHB-28]
MKSQLTLISRVLSLFSGKLTSTSTLASLIVVMVSPGISASTNASIQGLPNGNYRFCSNPPSTQVSDQELLEAGYCFLFRKTGSQIVGSYFNPSLSTEDAVCVTGQASNGIISGEGLQLSQGLPNGMSDFAGVRLTNWDEWGYLSVASATVLGTYEQTGYSQIHHRQAVLDLSNFYRYNAGIYLPPTDCFN